MRPDVATKPAAARADDAATDGDLADLCDQTRGGFAHAVSMHASPPAFPRRPDQVCACQIEWGHVHAQRLSAKRTPPSGPRRAACRIERAARRRLGASAAGSCRPWEVSYPAAFRSVAGRLPVVCCLPFVLWAGTGLWQGQRRRRGLCSSSETTTTSTPMPPATPTPTLARCAGGIDVAAATAGAAASCVVFSIAARPLSRSARLSAQ
eukprot:350755-Chlamydomonas_euryale.AAC.3